MVMRSRVSICARRRSVAIATTCIFTSCVQPEGAGSVFAKARPAVALSTMPESHGVWTAGCEWGCEAGYAVARLDYVLWVKWECVEEGVLGNGFWEWS